VASNGTARHRNSVSVYAPKCPCCSFVARRSVESSAVAVQSPRALGVSPLPVALRPFNRRMAHRTEDVG
jgi:hypothetical protein